RPVLARRRHNPAMGARQFGRYLDAAARCGVEDLRVELPEKPPSPDTPTKATTLRFPFPAAAGPALARLSLRGIGVSGLHSRAARPCSALEVVRLHSVPVDDRGLARMLALCPRIRVLGLHSCSALRRIAVTAATGRKLSSVTIAGCSWLIEVDVAAVSSLRSFRYTGGFLSSFYLPDNAAFADLYICFDAQRSCNVRICQKVFSDWFESRVCSKLTALTICSNVLFVVSSLPNGISHAESAKVGGHFFQSMTELQLLMLDMKAPELANIYVFLKNSQCSNLERLFVQVLPSIPSGPLVDSSNYVGVEPPEDVLENLKVVKITNFNWNRIEVQLVSFLLRKASSLHKLVLVTPSLVPLDVIGIQKEDLLLVGEAVANGKIILSKLDDAATKPFHSDVFAEV
uniref:FBD domain-containing protein n=1 Tax=Aegilops tauschii subsp. strangulata TaxID=200361 RepID=A0A453CX10_AEGTS